jgi:hypothetical protein
MADFNISVKMSVGILRSQVNDAFDFYVRGYHSQIFADDSVTLASISNKKVEDFTCKGSMKVGNLKTNSEKAAGIKVQVATRPDAKVEPGKLVNNDYTLSFTQSEFGA